MTTADLAIGLSILSLAANAYTVWTLARVVRRRDAERGAVEREADRLERAAWGMDQWTDEGLPAYRGDDQRLLDEVRASRHDIGASLRSIRDGVRR